MFQNSIESCPVLQPTLQEFGNFSQYVQKIEKIHQEKYGMVKIVPPSGWKPRSTSYDLSLNNLIIKNPIQQNSEGKMGIYEYKHIPLPSITYLNYIKEYEGRQKIVQQKTAQQTQDLFWKTIPYSAPVYGADLLGTLMDQAAGPWQLNELDTILKQGLQKNVRGVNTSYCYIGSWKALFCWHKQDLDLQAINFLHFGKSKFWYCIQPEDSAILEKEAKKYFFKAFSDCSQYLRHKTSLINPYLLKKNNPNLKISKVEQKPGQFIIAFSGAYHCGFNFGINVAQAVNFATPNWLEKLTKVKYCKCKKSSVKISAQSFINKLLQNQQYQNNETINKVKTLLEKQKQNQSSFQQSTKAIVSTTQIQVNRFKTKHISKTCPDKSSLNNNKKKKQRIDCKQKQKQINKKMNYITEIQCDLCSTWYQLPQNMLDLSAKTQFCCNLIGKRCLSKKQDNSDNNKNEMMQANDYENNI